MAPEVVLGRDYNEKADIFSLGVVMYEIFSKVITAAIVMTSSDPYECQDYAFKVRSQDRVQHRAAACSTEPNDLGWGKPWLECVSDRNW